MMVTGVRGGVRPGYGTVVGLLKGLLPSCHLYPSSSPELWPWVFTTTKGQRRLEQAFK